MLVPDTFANLDSQFAKLNQVGAEHTDTTCIANDEGFDQKTPRPCNMTRPCPAGTRYFRVFHTGKIITCDPLAIPLGNVKKKDVTSLKEETLCNLAGYCDCNTAVNSSLLR